MAKKRAESDRKNRIPAHVYVTGAFVLLAAIVAPFIADWINGNNTNSERGIRIANVNGVAPDFVTLENRDNFAKDISGFILKEDDKLYQVPDSTILGQNEKCRIWFLRDEDPLPSTVQEEDLISTAFRIKSGETVILMDKSGVELDRRKAR